MANYSLFGRLYTVDQTQYGNLNFVSERSCYEEGLLMKIGKLDNHFFLDLIGTHITNTLRTSSICPPLNSFWLEDYGYF